MRHEQLDTQELRAVLGVALLGLDDDVEPPALRVLLPSGDAVDVVGAAYVEVAGVSFVELRVDDYDHMPSSSPTRRRGRPPLPSLNDFIIEIRRQGGLPF